MVQTELINLDESWGIISACCVATGTIATIVYIGSEEEQVNVRPYHGPGAVNILNETQIQEKKVNLRHVKIRVGRTTNSSLVLPGRENSTILYEVNDITSSAILSANLRYFPTIPLVVGRFGQPNVYRTGLRINSVSSHGICQEPYIKT
jgi:hypothetical protein